MSYVKLGLLTTRLSRSALILQPAVAGKLHTGNIASGSASPTTVLRHNLTDVRLLAVAISCALLEASLLSFCNIQVRGIRVSVVVFAYRESKVKAWRSTVCKVEIGHCTPGRYLPKLYQRQRNMQYPLAISQRCLKVNFSSKTFVLGLLSLILVLSSS